MSDDDVTHIEHPELGGISVRMQPCPECGDMTSPLITWDSDLGWAVQPALCGLCCLRQAAAQLQDMRDEHGKRLFDDQHP